MLQVAIGTVIPIRWQMYNADGAPADPTSPFARLETGSGTFADLTAPAKIDGKLGFFGVDIATAGWVAGTVYTLRTGGTNDKGVQATSYQFMAVANDVDDLATTLASMVATLGTIAGYTDSLEGGVTALQSTANTVAGYTDSVETVLGQVQTALGNLDTEMDTHALEASLTALGVTLGGIGSAITTAQATMDTVAGFTDTLEAAVIAVQSTAAAIQERTDNLPDDPASQQAVIDAIDGNVTGDTLINQATCIDASGNIVAEPLGTALGVATPGSSLRLYPVLNGVADYSQAKRKTTAAADKTWEILAPAGTWELVVSLNDHWDSADGDSVKKRTLVIS